ncbi:MAG: polysulfide reductase NrfD [Chloroflexi bacterium]|nr:polysulfide reductase NrfD [Chloroflexota bacterium]
MATQTMVGATPRVSLGFYVWIGILGLLVLQGVYSFLVQTIEGFYVTSLTDTIPWGLYISALVFFIGASAGATVIGLLIHGFGRTDYLPLATRAILVGVVSLASAVLFVMMGVGSIPRAMLMPWFWNNPTSMFTYTSTSYYLFGLLLLGELYYTVKINRGSATARDARIAKWLAISAAPFALMAVHAVTGSLFAVLKARDFWNNPLLPPHFAVAALVTGTAIMLLVIITTAAATKRELVGRETLAHLGGLLGFFITLAGFFDLFDLLVFTYSDKLATNEAWHFLSAAHWPLTAVQVLGYAVGFVILVSGLRRSVPWLAAASVATILAVASYRYNLTTVGVSMPLYPFIEHEHYVPSLVEFSVTLGIVALALLAYTVLTRALPMEEAVPAAGGAPSPRDVGEPLRRPAGDGDRVVPPAEVPAR